MAKRLYTPAESEDVTMTIVEMESGQLCYIGSNWASQGTFFTYVYGMDANLYFTVDFNFWSQLRRGRSAQSTGNSTSRFLGAQAHFSGKRGHVPRAAGRIRRLHPQPKAT